METNQLRDWLIVQVPPRHSGAAAVMVMFVYSKDLVGRIACQCAPLNDRINGKVR